MQLIEDLGFVRTVWLMSCSTGSSICAGFALDCPMEASDRDSAKSSSQGSPQGFDKLNCTHQRHFPRSKDWLVASEPTRTHPQRNTPHTASRPLSGAGRSAERLIYPSLAQEEPHVAAPSLTSG